LSLEGPQLDARALVPAGASLADVFDVVLHGPLTGLGGGQSGGQGAARGLGAAKPGWRGAQTDASIRISLGQLMTAARTDRAAAVTGLVEGNAAQVIAALLAPSGSPGRPGSPGSGRVLVKAVGVPSEGLASLASAETGDLALDFRGRLVARESGNSAAGDLDI